MDELTDRAKKIKKQRKTGTKIWQDYFMEIFNMYRVECGDDFEWDEEAYKKYKRA